MQHGLPIPDPGYRVSEKLLSRKEKKIPQSYLGQQLSCGISLPSLLFSCLALSFFFFFGLLFLSNQKCKPEVPSDDAKRKTRGGGMSCHWSTVGFEGGAPEAKLPGLAGQSPSVLPRTSVASAMLHSLQFPRQGRRAAAFDYKRNRPGTSARAFLTSQGSISGPRR